MVNISSGIDAQTATINYLELLTTQLQNQDPIDPVDQQGLVNDLTQFSQLQGIEQLNDTFAGFLQVQQLGHATSLIGHEVSYTDSATGETRQGNVSEAFNGEGGIRLLIGGESVAIENVQSIRDDAATPTS